MVRFNTEGPEGLLDCKTSGPRPILTDTHRQALVVRSLLSVPDSGVNRLTKNTASGARGRFGQGIGQHESHH